MSNTPQLNTTPLTSLLSLEWYTQSTIPGAQGTCPLEVIGKLLHRVKAYPAKRRFLATLGLSLVTSAGFVLAFIVLDRPDDPWRAMVVGGAALMVAPILAGWLSPHPNFVAFFPASMLVGLYVATAIHGSRWHDSDPYLFPVLLTIIYGGWASATFFGGWLAHKALSRLTERR